MIDRVKEVLNTILEKFETGDVPQAIAYSMYPAIDVPSGKWSLLNRTIMFFHGTMDARGFRQWQRASRYVKKGSKGFHILVPYIKKFTDEATGQETERLVGFGLKAVFRVEDTDGQALEYQQLELPELPLLERAEEWGISVKAIPGNYRYSGYYSPTEKQICLATAEECVFFHELAHAAHDKVKGGLKNGQDPFQEIVAELSAQALCRVAGKQANDSLGNSYRYIKSYAERLGVSPHAACMKVMSDTEKVLGMILKIEKPMAVMPEAKAA